MLRLHRLSHRHDRVSLRRARESVSPRHARSHRGGLRAARAEPLPAQRARPSPCRVSAWSQGLVRWVCVWVPWVSVPRFRDPSRGPLTWHEDNSTFGAQGTALFADAHSGPAEIRGRSGDSRGHCPRSSTYWGAIPPPCSIIRAQTPRCCTASCPPRSRGHRVSMVPLPGLPPAGHCSNRATARHALSHDTFLVAVSHLSPLTRFPTATGGSRAAAGCPSAGALARGGDVAGPHSARAGTQPRRRSP